MTETPFLAKIDVAHAAAKNMIELSRIQDEECGDGTTSVIILGTYLIAFNSIKTTYRVP